MLDISQLNLSGSSSQLHFALGETEAQGGKLEEANSTSWWLSLASLVPADNVKRRPAVVGVLSSFPLASREQREEVEKVAWGPPPAPSWRCAGDAGASVAFQGEKLLLM